MQRYLCHSGCLYEGSLRSASFLTDMDIAGPPSCGGRDMRRPRVLNCDPRDTTDVPEEEKMSQAGLPPAQGLYDPRHEHDSCGVGFVAHIKGQKTHQLVDQGITAVEHLAHRGATGCEEDTGDGAGVLI
ncbi:MAG: hypothetical protein ACE1ZN_05385, partial [Dehalococcoidia bacterium]